MSLWEMMQRVVAAAQNSFESVMNAVSGVVNEDARAGRDPCKLHSLSEQVAFTIAVIGLGAKMAKADGVVTPDEVDAFREVFHIPPGEERNVRRVFDLARQDVAGYESYAKKIAKLFRRCPMVLEDLLDGLFHIAKADGVVHPKEEEFLERVAGIFGFEQEQYERIRCAHLNCPNSDPYSVLGVKSDITSADLKKVYHRLVRENHPDALMARGVPEEFVSMATAKLAVINTAYEQITQKRAAALVS